MARPPEKPPVLDDPDAPPTDEEVALAAELRAALDGQAASTNAGADARLLRALALAHEPRPIDDAEHRALVDRAVATKRTPARRSNVVRVTFGLAGAVAIAASVALLIRSSSQPDAASSAAMAPAAAPAVAVAARAESATTPVSDPSASALAVPRSTQSLFDAPFTTATATARASSGSARIDRIAAARRADLRENRFARWGVK